MLNWNNIDTVLLDMDGTLLDLHFDNYFWQTHLVKRYAELHTIEANIAKQQLYQHFSSISGTLDWYCLDYWSRELKVDIVQLKREVEHLIAILPFAKEFLMGMQSYKPLHLVTNAHRDSLNLKLAHTHIEDFFGEIISAHDYQQPKENLKFWQILQTNLVFDPSRTLLVDDNLNVLETAKTFGIGHLLTITKPDSQAAVKQVEGFMAIEHFGELLPIK